MFFSICNYNEIINTYWLPIFIKYSVISFFCLGSVFYLFKPTNVIYNIGYIDITILILLIYRIFNSIGNEFPSVPPEDTFQLIFFTLFYLLIRFHLLQNIVANSRLLTDGIILVVIIQSLIGLWQQYYLIEHYAITQKSSGTFINPGIYGFFLVMGLLLCFNQIIYQENSTQKKKLYTIAFLIIFISLLYSASRTSFIALLVGVCLQILLLCNSNFLKRIFKSPILYVGGLILCIGLYFIININTDSIKGRFLIWKISLSMTKENPITGNGTGSYFVQYGDFQAKYFLNSQSTEQETLLASMNYYPFNEYLKILIEEGVLGLILFIGFILSVLMFSYKVFSDKALLYKKSTSSLSLFISIGISALIFGFFSYPSQDISISLILLIVISFIAQIQTIYPPFWHLKGGSVKGINYLAGMISVCLLIISVGKVYASLNWKQAKENILLQEASSLKTYANIYPFLSNDGAFLYNYGSELSDMGLYREAQHILERANIYGNSVELKIKLAENYACLKDFKSAEYYYIQAAYMNPKLFVPFEALFKFYKNRHQEQQAKKIAYLICKKPIKIISDQVINIKKQACNYIQ